MPLQMTQPELIRDPRSAEGHLRGIIVMVEAGADCQDILHEVRAVRGALDQFKRRLIDQYLHECLRTQLADPEWRFASM